LNNDVLLPSKDIQSRIDLLEHVNNEWQEKFIRLKEQMGRCENQSRIYYRDLMKYYKLLYDAGL
jgi:uncharacterized membrane protein